MFLEIETIIIQIDKKTIVSHHTEKIKVINIHEKSIEVVHLNTKDK